MKADYLLLCVAVCLVSCRDNGAGASASKPVTQVNVTYPSLGNINQETVLTAVTAYQGKSAVSAPVASFVVSAHVKPGVKVKAGDILYRLESKEQHALGHGNHYIDVKSACNGIVLDVNAQSGSYVTEGEVLCTVVDARSMVFEINVPYEQRQYVKEGSHCVIELPDGTRLSAMVKFPLATMDVASQSEKVVAVAKAPLLPEGMSAKAIFTSRSATRAVPILPKSAVQSDETMTEFWIMRLADDSIAAKVMVVVGNSTRDSIEILSPALSTEEKVINEGSYGLPDKAKVVVIQ